jgi:hypothetical protein
MLSIHKIIGKAPLVVWANTLLVMGLAYWFMFYPSLFIALHAGNKEFQTGTIPKEAISLHRKLSPRLEKWARNRVASRRAASLWHNDISGTEWPLFGCVFYLWATEAIAENHGYSRDAVHAAAELVIDPNHATWVQEKWGSDYLHQENVFYRALVIAALTARAKLLLPSDLSGDALGRWAKECRLDLLSDQVESLANELSSSTSGLLDDYPGECYPTDVLMAVVCIRRADAVLGTDHTAFAKRAKRAFSGSALTEEGLPPYAADARSGLPVTPARGCGNSFMCSIVPELWPEIASEWYARYDDQYWQYRWGAYGFREYPKTMPDTDWYGDVDAGPSIFGHGFAASAFGVGAARANGRFDHAYPLTAEMLAISWPLPNGRLALPALLSNMTDAPYLGECAILYNLTRQPIGPAPSRPAATLPLFVYLMFACYFIPGMVVVLSALWRLRGWRHPDVLPPLWPKVQTTLWLLCIAAAVGAFFAENPLVALLGLMVAQLLPRRNVSPC